jgi:hypothetical protein
MGTHAGVSRTQRSARLLARGQGYYFLITGIWPLVHMPSFLWVTGPKADFWLVETVGVLVIAIGLALVTSSLRPLPPRPVIIQAMAAAAGLATIEVIYVLNGTIWPIYLADAVVEVVFITWWTILVLGHRKNASPAA